MLKLNPKLFDTDVEQAPILNYPIHVLDATGFGEGLPKNK